MLTYYINKIIRKILLSSAVKNSALDKTARIGIGCNLAGCSIGQYSYVGDFSSLTKVKIGNYTSISSYCVIGGGAHPLTWVSTSPVFTDSKSILRKTIMPHHFEPHKNTVIGNDVWIGTHVLIKAGVVIGDGAVIGMGSVVTKDVGPYEIWAGNPAKCIRRRFPDDVITKIHESEWYYWDENKLKQYAEFFNDPAAFLSAIEEVNI